MVEEYDLPLDRTRRQLAESVKGGHNHHLSGKAVSRGRHTAAERRQHDFLCRFALCRGRHAGPFRQRACFLATHPVRDRCLLQGDRGAQFAHLVCHVFHCLARLGRTAQTRPDVVCQVTQLGQSIVVRRRCVAQLAHIGNLLGAPRAVTRRKEVCHA